MITILIKFIVSLSNNERVKLQLARFIKVIASVVHVLKHTMKVSLKSRIMQFKMQTIAGLLSLIHQQINHYELADFFCP